MFFKKDKKRFYIIIGNNESLVILYKGQYIEKKILCDDFKNKEQRQYITNLVLDNKSADISIFINDRSQNYKNQIYSNISKSDITSIAKRKILKEKKENFVQKYKIKKDKLINKWECLFVSFNISDLIRSWIDFVISFPNKIKGVYMLPLEISTLVNLILDTSHSTITNDKKIAKKDKKKTKKVVANYLIFRSKVLDTVQIVFLNNEILLTRIMNYNFSSADFLDRFNQDIVGTNEYLRRILHDINIDQTNLILLLEEDILDRISTIKDKLDLNLISYTPYDLASKLNLQDGVIKKSVYSDTLIVNFLNKSKSKILRILTPKLTLSVIFKSLSQVLFIANIFLLLSLVTFTTKSIIDESDKKYEIKKINDEYRNKRKILREIKSSSVLDNGSNISVDEVLDFGKINTILSVVSKGNGFKVFDKLKSSISKIDHVLLLKQYSYSGNIANSYRVLRENYGFSSDIINKNGDVEELFVKYDKILSNLKSEFKSFNMVNSSLPKDISFVEKYYVVPFNFTLRQ